MATKIELEETVAGLAVRVNSLISQRDKMEIAVKEAADTKCRLQSVIEAIDTIMAIEFPGYTVSSSGARLIENGFHLNEHNAANTTAIPKMVLIMGRLREILG